MIPPGSQEALFSPGRPAAAVARGSNKQRMLMRPWLVQQARSKRVAGVVFMDEEETLLKLSWKHASSQSWKLNRDASIFQLWAKHTGKYDEGDQNPKRWKANFRCAINSLPDVREEKELSQSRGPNAYKVYRLLDEKKTRRKAHSPTADMISKRQTRTPMSQHIPGHDLMPMARSPESPETPAVMAHSPAPVAHSPAAMAQSPAPLPQQTPDKYTNDTYNCQLMALSSQPQVKNTGPIFPPTNCHELLNLRSRNQEFFHHNSSINTSRTISPMDSRTGIRPMVSPPTDHMPSHPPPPYHLYHYNSRCSVTDAPVLQMPSTQVSKSHLCGGDVAEVSRTIIPSPNHNGYSPDSVGITACEMDDDMSVSTQSNLEECDQLCEFVLDDNAHDMMELNSCGEEEDDLLNPESPYNLLQLQEYGHQELVILN